VATKVKKAREILEEGDKILITVFFRGREQAHKEIGRALIEKIKKDLEDVSKLEHDISMQGPRMQITLLPKPPGSGPPKPTSGGGQKPPPAAPPPPPPTAPAPVPAPAPAPASQGEAKNA
jgi:translation initiation factor IF-3